MLELFLNCHILRNKNKKIEIINSFNPKVTFASAKSTSLFLALDTNGGSNIHLS